jgi:hypothetical protein
VKLGSSGVVEIDETKSSTVRGYAGWKHPVFKWILGMICRTTKIMVIYYIKNRRRQYLYPLMKKHLEKGSTVITDEHPSYVNLKKA